MKTASGAMASKINSSDNTLVSCFFVKQRISGRIQGFTEHDQNVPFDLSDGNGEIIYQASAAFTRTAIATNNTMSVDNLEIEGVLDPEAFDNDDIDAGRYDRAEIKIFLVDWTDLTLGAIKIRRGTLGEIATAEKGFEAELSGMMHRYTEEILELYTPSCRVDLGEPLRCKVPVDPPVWVTTTAYTVTVIRDAGVGSRVKPTTFNDRHFKCTTAGTSGGSEPSWNLTIGGTTADGSVVWTTIQALTIEATVNVVTNNGNFTLTYSGDAPNALLEGGLIKFTNRLNNGLNMEVKKWTLSSNTVQLFLPMPLDVGGIANSFLGLESSGNLLLENGDDLLLEDVDTVKIQAGCKKDIPACQGFDNIFNQQAEPRVPGKKVLVRTPNAVDG